MLNILLYSSLLFSFLMVSLLVLFSFSDRERPGDTLPKGKHPVHHRKEGEEMKKGEIHLFRQLRPLVVNILQAQDFVKGFRSQAQNTGF